MANNLLSSALIMREVRAGIYTGRYHVSMLKLTNEVGQIGVENFHFRRWERRVSEDSKLRI